MNESALALPAHSGNVSRIPAGHPTLAPAALSAALPIRSKPRPAGRDLALAGIAHDARNLVTSLRLCADLMAEPGVFAEGQGHFAGQIHALVDAADHIVRRLSSVSRTAILASEATAGEVLIDDLADAVRQLANLLSAVAGPATEIEIACLPCAGRLRLSEESLTRILLNLVRNASDAMPVGGRIRITAQRSQGANFFWTVPAASPTPSPATSANTPGPQSSGAEGCSALNLSAPCESDLWSASFDEPGSGTILLTVEDDGPGISPDLVERIFEPGFSTRRGPGPWPDAQHHGLGLSIVRELVEAAGGTVRAGAGPGRGARFEIELPLTNVTPSLPLVARSPAESDPQ